MTPGTLLIAYVFVLLTLLAGVARYCDIRRRRFEPKPTADTIYRCSDCGYVYTDDADVDRSRCPQCGLINDTIRF
jgi:predicted Zn-ribbon and HTH transcriptional regulator